MSPGSRLLIAEDHSILRAGVRVLLSREPDLEVVGETDNWPDTLQLVRASAPDLVMTGLAFREGDGVDAIAEIITYCPGTRILVLLEQKTEDSIRAALRVGAHGYVPKDASDAELIRAVRSVLGGHTYLSPAISDKIINVFLVGGRSAAAKSNLHALTKREREILKMIAEGHTSKHIAGQLQLSIKTVEKHRSNLMRKLDLHNVSALTTFAIGQGLVTTG
jgi:DNA-binding NarL/FixJ family response regulator